MVLTNFELWAADGSSAASLPLDYESNTHTRHLNPFDPRVVPQLNTNLNHLSSNGYYGFSYVNAAHIHDNNNNNNMSNNNNNYNGTAYNLMANDVNGMNNTVTTTPQQTNASSVNFGSSAYAAGHAVNVARCKKRYFVINDDNDTTAGAVANNYEVSAKRCRFDDDFSAQYCNDFFQLPSTQIATQSCLMDTEEAPQQQQQQQHEMLQQQVDEAMFENNNNIVKYEENSNRQLENVQTLTHQNQQHNQQHSQQHLVQTQQPTQQQQSNVYHHHHQQHYQDMYATFKCHFNNNSCDTLTLNNKHSRTCQINSKCTENKLNSLILKPNKWKLNENEKLCKNDNDVANDFKVDDATLFAQLHGGCLHHHHNTNE